ncbi:MAG: hypothetical protein K8T89_18195 [Planctomycetes bacterium]|nr:hypothetical protein [Planctomycetota bacterium]
MRLIRLLILPLVILSVSAAPPEDSIRDANKSFEKGEIKLALRLYEEAEEYGNDPGLIAFNKAAAYFAIDDVRQAEKHFRMSLDDAAAPRERRIKALYNLGNCLVRQAGEKDYKTFRDAIRCYELCLDEQPEAGLRTDAAHNLELAKLLWRKALAGQSDPPTPNTDDPPEQPRPTEPKKETPGMSEAKEPKTKDFDPTKDKLPKDPKKIEIEGKLEAKKTIDVPKPNPSRAPLIPDSDQLNPLTKEETRLALQFAEDRLRKERQRNRVERTTPENASGRDW